MTRFVPPKDAPPPRSGPRTEPPVTPRGFLSSVFKTRPQLEAEIRDLKKENALLRSYIDKPRVIVAADGTKEAAENPTATEVRTGPCRCCLKTRDILGEVLARHEGTSYAVGK
jgi:hypothetical protein